MTPDQEDQLKQEAAFAAMGQQVLDNAAYKHWVTIRKAQIFEDFCNTKKDQSDIREEAWRTMKNLNTLEDFFKEVLTTGKMATAQLESHKEE